MCLYFCVIFHWQWTAVGCRDRVWHPPPLVHWSVAAALGARLAVPRGAEAGGAGGAVCVAGRPADGP